MAYNYLRYAILCPHLQLVMSERPSPRYNNDIRRLNIYQYCILSFIIITLIEIIIIAMFTICITFFYV